MNRFQFVEDHKDAYGVKRLCDITTNSHGNVTDVLMQNCHRCPET